VKEFLSQNDVVFEHIDILSDPRGMELLRSLGVRNVPVVARGGEFVFGQKLDDVARFVGLRASRHQSLTAEELLTKWTTVLEAVYRYTGQLTASQLTEAVIEGRPRSVRLLAHHIFRIAELFLETAVDGTMYQSMQLDMDPPDDTFNAPAEIREYGRTTIERLMRWWNNVEDKNCMRNIETFYGTQSLHSFLERCTWHSAQHARQMIAVLERLRIAPDGRLTQEDYAGLPMPKELR
jgi:hypothetical protein